MASESQFKVFKSHFDSWDAMAQEIAQYLTALGPDKAISVSHSQESQLGVIIVWYWN